jgi:hypothetical protein
MLTVKANTNHEKRKNWIPYAQRSNSFASKLEHSGLELGDLKAVKSGVFA